MTLRDVYRDLTASSTLLHRKRHCLEWFGSIDSCSMHRRSSADFETCILHPQLLSACRPARQMLAGPIRAGTSLVLQRDIRGGASQPRSLQVLGQTPCGTSLKALVGSAHGIHGGFVGNCRTRAPLLSFRSSQRRRVLAARRRLRDLRHEMFHRL